MTDLFSIGTILDSKEKLEINLPYLIKSRMLIQANAGGGKSYCIRKLLEETHGKVQQIVLDLEGEFATLREKYDYVLIGRDGDIPAEIRSAEMLAKKLLENNISAIIDLSELKKHERILFVKRFLDSMMESKRELWHPCLVIVDEAHQFCPEKGKAESMASVIDLATRGRKRGYCAVLATQRLSKLHKDAAAECNNKLIGRTGLDIDMKRAAEELGFTSKDEMRSLRMLDAGEFYSFGVAMTREVKKVKIGKVKTSHPEAGTGKLIAPKSSTEKIKNALKKLIDLPQKAEEELKEKADLQAKIRELKMQLRKVPVRVDEKAIERAKEQGFKEAERSYKIATNESNQKVKELLGKLNKIRNIATGQAVQMSHLNTAFKQTVKQPFKPSPKVIELKPTKIPITEFIDEPTTLRTGAMKMLKAVAMFPEPITKLQVATLAGFSVKGGTFGTYLSELKRAGWLNEKAGKLSITMEGQEKAGDVPDLPTDPNELVNFWAGKFRAGAAKMLRVIAERYPSEITKEDLAEETGFTATGGTFTTYLSELRRNHLIEIEGETIKATKTLFLEE